MASAEALDAMASMEAMMVEIRAAVDALAEPIAHMTANTARIIELMSDQTDDDDDEQAAIVTLDGTTIHPKGVENKSL